jgi:flagellar basal-body rod protein FlgF
MDRLIHTALNSLANLRDTRVTSAQNLANLAVPFWRRAAAHTGNHFSPLQQEIAAGPPSSTGPLLFINCLNFTS